jgi:hypothetical protein
MALVYYRGAELPDAEITWLDSSNNIIDFSSGYTFVAKLGTPGSTALLTKSSGITGAATAPNVLIAWTANELALTPGTYSLDIIATTGGKDRIQSTPITITQVVT